MPRPKPPQPLKPYGLRLSYTDIEALRLLGGSTWLRNQIRKHGDMYVIKRDRAKSVRADYENGVRIVDIASKHGLSERRVYEIIRTYRKAGHAILRRHKEPNRGNHQH